MTKKQILSPLKKYLLLKEVHGGNSFSLRPYQKIISMIDNGVLWLEEWSSETLLNTEGVSKNIAGILMEIVEKGTFDKLEELIDKTPAGILDLAQLKGLGPKKIMALWMDSNITTPEDLILACDDGRLAKAKGFGAKSIESLRESAIFWTENHFKEHWADAEPIAERLIAKVKEIFPTASIALVGDFAMDLPEISALEMLIGSLTPISTHQQVTAHEDFTEAPKTSGPFTFRGKVAGISLPTTIHFVNQADFVAEKFKRTAMPQHLNKAGKSGQSLRMVLEDKTFENEQQIYEAAELPFIQLPMRNGTHEWEWAQQFKAEDLITTAALQGPIHNHTHYSDGMNSLQEMADYCIAKGWKYIGISDHSQTAAYANGLSAERVLAQQAEIDELNASFKDFKIFKGIESDILQQGELDYPEEILKTFDFIVASIHGNLSMDLETATNRLLRAIENPYTTMLGHPTGRLLLKRAGYPIDHQRIIDACAEHQVIIEINANPWRLDLDWQWVNYAVSKGVMISINPDAHVTTGLDDMRYGVKVAKKAGLTIKDTFNAKSREEVAAYFAERKSRIQ